MSPFIHAGMLFWKWVLSKWGKKVYPSPDRQPPMASLSPCTHSTRCLGVCSGNGDLPGTVSLRAPSSPAHPQPDSATRRGRHDSPTLTPTLRAAHRLRRSILSPKHSNGVIGLTYPQRVCILSHAIVGGMTRAVRHLSAFLTRMTIPGYLKQPTSCYSDAETDRRLRKGGGPCSEGPL